MSITIIQTVDVLVNVMIIFLLMKLVVNPREFYFNSALRPVDAVTEPLLQKLRLIVHPVKNGIDYTPLVAIIALFLLRIGVYWGLTPLGAVGAIVRSSMMLLQFLLSFFAFSIFVLFMVPVYSRNPLSSFLKTVVKPFEKPFQSIGQGRKTLPLIGALILAILIVSVLSVFLSAFIEDSPAKVLGAWQTWVRMFLVMVNVAIGVYRFVVILLVLSVILSWVNAEVRHPVINLIYVLTEPILLPIRRVIPPAGGLDLSPWFACIVIGIIGRFLNGFIANIIVSI